MKQGKHSCYRMLALLIKFTPQNIMRWITTTLSRLFSFKTFFLGRFRIEASFLQFHHKTVFLTSPLENPHRFLKTVRVGDLDFDHGVFTYLYAFMGS